MCVIGHSSTKRILSSTAVSISARTPCLWGALGVGGGYRYRVMHSSACLFAIQKNRQNPHIIRSMIVHSFISRGAYGRELLFKTELVLYYYKHIFA